MPTNRSFPWVRFVIVLFLVAVDQWSKGAVFSWLGDHTAAGLERDHHGHRRYPILGEWFGFMLSYNKGAAFGRFGDYPYLLVIGRGIAVLCLSWLVYATDRRQRVVLIAMVLVLAGAIGNLGDNLFTGGREEGHPFGMVRDFIDVWFIRESWGWDYHFHTFNVADSCITVGACLWVLSGFFHRPDEEKETSEEEVPSEPVAVSEGE